MLGNKISPASLCNPESSEESQSHSQASLFGSDAPSSMELFSQSVGNSQSGQSHGQFGHRIHHLQGMTHQLSQDMLAPATEQNSQSQGSLPSSQKYYMKYLKASSLTGSRKEPLTTPLRTEKQLGGNSESMESFHNWKSKLKEKHSILDGVVSVVKDATNQMQATMESLKSEIIGLKETSASKPAEKCNLDELAALQTRTFAQLLEGQEGIKQRLNKLEAAVFQQSQQIVTVSHKISSLEYSDLSSEQVQAKITCLVKASTETGLKPLIAKLDSFEAKYCRSVPQQQTCRENRYTSDQSVPSESGYLSPRDYLLPVLTDAAKSEEVTVTATQKIASQRSDTSCDVDLTQCSPSHCQEILSQCLQQKKIASSQVVNDPNATTLQIAIGSQPQDTNVRHHRGPHKRIKLQSPLDITERSPATTRRRSQRRRSQPKSYKFSPMFTATVDDNSCSPTTTPSENFSQKSNTRTIRKIKKPQRHLAPLIGISASTHEQPKPPLSQAGAGFFESTAVHNLPRQPSTQPTPTYISSSVLPASSGVKFQRSSEAAKRGITILAGLSRNTVREISESLRQQQPSSPESPN